MDLKLFIIIFVLFGYSKAAWNVTCDFDLEGIENIIKYLPTECIEIYKQGVDSELYQASLREYTAFADFYKKLERYERRPGSKPNEVPTQNTKLRFHIYNTTLLNTCGIDIANRTDLTTDGDRANKYYECLSLKRDEMIKLIPK
ncbi:uncharacterized protein LOC129941581 [Eupeodes corollae]|uniref:uncharacterized protein LOC129941581 n=1 Tax=Eupeodes corollae TaxID=290404 RepID=UPI00249147EF|nr:uncharacterized protein LOC129941581 [Eupeodes corollae]